MHEHFTLVEEKVRLADTSDLNGVRRLATLDDSAAASRIETGGSTKSTTYRRLYPILTLSSQRKYPQNVLRLPSSAE
jgi:hypothetical protein